MMLLYAPRATSPNANAVGNALDRIAFRALCLFVFVLPWQDADFVIGGSNIRWIGWALFGIAVLRTYLLQDLRPINELHYWMLAFAGWSIASLFWTMDWGDTTARVGTYLQLLAVAWLIWTLATTEPRVARLLQAYVFGTYICATYTIANALAGNSYMQLYGAPRGDRFIMNGMNPNDAGMLMAPSIPMTLYLLARRPRPAPLTALLYWLQLVLCGATICLSGSREAVLEAVPASLMLLMVLVSLPSAQKFWAVTAVVVAAAASLYLVPSETWQRLGEIGGEVTEGTMTHRTEIWKAGIDVFQNHPLVGIGAAAHPEAVVGIIGRPLAAHNTFISALVELGVIGELLLLGLLTVAVALAFRLSGVARLLWLALGSIWVIGACSATWEYQKTTWFLLSMLAAHGSVGRRIAPALRMASGTY